MWRNMDITIQPRASCKHVNITLEIIFSAKFDGYIAAMRLCVCVCVRREMWRKERVFAPVI